MVVLVAHHTQQVTQGRRIVPHNNQRGRGGDERGRGGGGGGEEEMRGEEEGGEGEEEKRRGGYALYRTRFATRKGSNAGSQSVITSPTCARMGSGGGRRTSPMRRSSARTTGAVGFSNST